MSAFNAREFLKRLGVTAALLLLPGLLGAVQRQSAPSSRGPNIVLIITDDQGYGDLGFHGNPKIKTPHLDRLARESVQLQRFYVSPVCSPTRASLLTGRYNYRTGVVDTYIGRSLMHPDETTLAELLAQAGYRTGIFGKWHLGDNYPMRAMDQGFQQSLVLNGGGIGQPSDPPGGESYFDPLLRRNGEWVKTRGYVSDCLTDAAIEFIGKNRSRPFFTYLAFNAPHTPLEVPEKSYQTYKQMNLKPEDFPGAGHPLPKNFDADTTAKIFGMVENVDENIGRLLQKLDELKLAEETVVIFLTDNGPQQPRYNAGMFQRKGNPHEGGIRVPFFVRWPGKFAAGRKVDRIAAHIDVTPTLLDICGVARPAKVKFDGVSLLPLLKGGEVSWPDRTLFIQWHRGDAPELYRAFAARSQAWKLVQPNGSGDVRGEWKPDFRLYDMQSDPLEQKNIAGERPDIVEKMKQDYAAWFRAVTSGRDYTHPQKAVARIFIGALQENPVRLTRQDWRGPQAGWTRTSLGHWEVAVQRAGEYEITLRFDRLGQPGVIGFSLGGVKLQKDVPAGATTAVFDRVRLARGGGTLESHVRQGEQKIGMLDVVVRHLR